MENEKNEENESIVFGGEASEDSICSRNIPG